MLVSVLTLSAQDPPQAGQRGRGRGADQFTGQPRVNALVISGGGFHDYPLQAKVLVDSVSRVLPVDWTVAIQGGRVRPEKTSPPEPRLGQGFDIVVHNQCFADTTDEALIQRITSAQRGGPPAIVIHCAMHTYRASTADTWREFLGVTTKRHTKAHNISGQGRGQGPPDHEGLQGKDWVTPVDELYVIDKFWPNSQALATAVSPEDQKEYPLAWVSDYGGSRVFGTTIGHGNDTWNDPVFQDLLGRAFKWALKRD